MACKADPPQTNVEVSALHGFEGAFDYAIDAPWRIEPHIIGPDSLHDFVPITVAILDEDTNAYSTGVHGGLGLGRLQEVCSIEVEPLEGTQPGFTFDIDDLEWIERIGGPESTPTYWPTPAQGLPPPQRRVCHPALEDCESMRGLLDTSEWHALLLWRVPGLPGQSVPLKLTVNVAGLGTCDSDERYMIKLVNYARVNWAYSPLPRFGDDRWLYGDLHYHSQSTDNEGESGYSYRASLHGLSSIGLDFAFATDHASDAEQIVDADFLSVTEGFGPEDIRGLRDLSQPRWDWAQSLLHAPDGANAKMAALWPVGRARIPRMFLGGEVDVVPELPQKPAVAPWVDPAQWSLQYGNGLVYDLVDHVCDGWITELSPCSFDTTELFVPFTDVNGATAFMPKDTQGFNTHKIGRQHLLHIPRFADIPNGFVGSHTGRYGGATRHLVEGSSTESGVLADIAQKHGIAFLAHPLEAGPGGKGPGMLPYTDYQLAKAFDQRALVGLQLWNENNRLRADRDSSHETGHGGFEVTGYNGLDFGDSGSHMPGWFAGEYMLYPVDDAQSWRWSMLSFETDRNLHNGAHVWDHMLRWGLDLGRTRTIGWLPTGEPRRMFMAGGSDAHGDLNYRRNGYMTGLTNTTTSAAGSVRNLVHAGTPRTPCSADGRCVPEPAVVHSQDQIVEALGEGYFSVTDGPALRIVVDRNRNGVIDDTDTPMGGVVELYDLPGDEDQLPLLVQWETNVEWGWIQKIDLYVGVASDPCDAGSTACNATPDENRARTYAPENHGVRLELAEAVATGGTQADLLATADNCFNGVPCQMQDGYWRAAMPEARGKLHHEPDPASTLWAVTLDLDDYPVPTGQTKRVYVRAFAKTMACDPLDPANGYAAFRGGCISRYAFTNPVWALRKQLVAGAECPFSNRALDADNDGYPDQCDAFPTQAAMGWTRTFGGASVDTTSTVAFDTSSNPLVAGTLFGSGTIEGATGPAATLPVSVADAVIARFSPTGEMQQRFMTTGNGTARIHDITVDENNDIYVVGSFSGALGIGGWSLAADDTDGFVAKLRGTDFTVRWVRQFSGFGRADIRRVVRIPPDFYDAGIAIAGDFSGTLGTLSGNYVAQGASDCWITILTANGVQTVTRPITGSGSCTATDLAADMYTFVYLAGNYSSAITHGTRSLTTSGPGGFVAKVNSFWEGHTAGILTGFGGSQSWEGDANVSAIAVDANDRLRIAGTFKAGLTLIRPQQSAYTALLGGPTTNWDMFTIMLTNTGDPIASSAWSWGGDGDDEPHDLQVEPDGTTLLAGSFTSSQLSLGAPETLVRRGARDGFFAMLDPSGATTFLRNIGTTGENRAVSVAFSPNGTTWAVGGSFVGSANIDDARTVSSRGFSDGFLTQFSRVTLGTAGP